MSIDRRLIAIESVLGPMPSPGSGWNFDRLSPEEITEIVALDRKAAEQGGLHTLTRAEIERGAELAEKSLGRPVDIRPVPSWPEGWSRR